MKASRRASRLWRLLIATLVTAVLVGVAPSAPAQAADGAALEDVTVLPGASATFSFDGGGTAFIRWFRVGVSDPVLTDSSTYTIENVTEQDDGAQFYATYYDHAFNPVQTRTATLTVGAVEVGFTSVPEDVTVLEGRRATFDVGVDGTSPFTYQWQTSGDEGASWDDVPDATGSSLTLRPTLDQDGDLVRVVVDNPVSDPTPSPAARLTVQAQDVEAIAVSDASLLWGLNKIYQGGNPAGNGCSFFSAGTQLEFASSDRDVRIVHETEDGLVSVSEGTKCLGQATSGMQQRILLTGGEGTATPETGQAQIHWEGAFAANAYGGLVPWWLKDLTLTVGRDGTGTLDATAGGYGSDRDNPDEMHPIPERPVTVATFQDVTITESGIVVEPDYTGVEITLPDDSIAEPQYREGSRWGGWPQSFVDFHLETGLSSYWYSSNLSADPDKPPFPLTVDFLSGPAVTQLPAVTAAPALVGGPTIVNGRTVTVTAAVADADSLHWERSTSSASTGSWDRIEGQNSETLTFEATPDWNNTWVRVVASNDAGTVASAPAQVKTQNFAAPEFSVQPTPVTAFAGETAMLSGRATGFPAVSPESYRVEVSRDDGATWQIVDDAYRADLSRTYAIPAVSADWDGALLRLTASTSEGPEAGSPGSAAVSAAVPLTVLPATPGPQLAVLNDQHIDPTEQTTLTIIGKGFAFPERPSADESYSLDLALFDADNWTPGSGGLTRVDGTRTSPNTWIGGGAIYESYLESRDGTFAVSLTIPANTLDPATVYGVGAYSRLTDRTTLQDTWNDRTNDAWMPVVVEGQEPARITSQPENVHLPEGGGVAQFAVAVSGTPDPTVTWEQRVADSEDWIAVEDATGTALDVRVTRADHGTAFRAVVDNGLANQASEPAVVTVAAAGDPEPGDPPEEPTPDPGGGAGGDEDAGPGGDTDTGPGGDEDAGPDDAAPGPAATDAEPDPAEASSGAVGDALATTGVRLAAGLALAAMLLIGAGAVLSRPVRRRS